MPYTRPSQATVDFNLDDDSALLSHDALALKLVTDVVVIIYPVAPGITHRVAAPFHPSATLTDASARHVLHDAADRGTGATLAFDTPAPHSPPCNLPWGEAPEKDRRNTLGWEMTGVFWGQTNGQQRAPWGDAPNKAAAPIVLPWGEATARDDAPVTAPFHDAPARDLAKSGSWRSTQLHRRAASYARNYRLPAPFGVHFDPHAGAVQAGDALRFALRVNRELGEEVLRLPADASQLLPWGRPPQLDDDYALRWGWGHSKYRKDARWRINYPDTDDPILKLPEPGDDPDIQDTYLAMNLITVTRVSDALPLAMHDIQIALDIDSWAWTFQGTVLNQGTMSAIAPTNGLVDIRVEINGHAWVFMIEAYSGSTRHGDQRWTVQGVSRTQYMAAPYALRTSYTNAAQINAVQAATAVLQYTGYLLDWNYLPGDTTPDWTYPPGALNYQDKTPLEVILGIARSVGAVLIPHRATDGWVLQPRLRASPWSLDSAYMNAIVHHAGVTELGEQYQPAPLYNGAFVSGINHGQGVSVTRYGTAGDQGAPDVFDAAVVAHDQAKERGRQIIANSGNHSIATITCRLPAASTAPGLIEPGDQLEYQGPTETWRGYVLGVAISAPGSGAINLYQRVQVIRYHEQE
jgi:hypothetical protein